MRKSWKTLRVVVELPVYDNVYNPDFSVRDLARGVAESLEKVPPTAGYDEGRIVPLPTGKARVVGYGQHLAAKGRAK